MPIRVCMVGSKGAGKTTIASRIGGSSFSRQTCQADTVFASCSVIFRERCLDLEILDISGEDRLLSMAPIYYKQAKSALCVFDLTSEKSYLQLHRWIDSIRSNASHECLLIILGNKLDLAEQRQVSSEEASSYAQSIGAKYYEVSATTGVGLLSVVIDLAKEILTWNDCSSTYAAKRSIVANNMEYISPRETVKQRRFSFPLRRLSFSRSKQ